MTTPVSVEPIVRGDPTVFPPYRYPAYRSTLLRAPQQPPITVPLTLSEQTGPGPALHRLTAADADLTRNAGTGGEALGQRIIVSGQVCDTTGKPIPDALIEIWQANAAGRYRHKDDQSTLPLDPHFLGAGRCLTDAQGRYRFRTIRPGAYFWRNHANAWRPAHIHFSLVGHTWTARLITQMYFADDPLLDQDPIVQSVPLQARSHLIARYDHSLTEPGQALGWRWDIVLTEAYATLHEASENNL